jgi:hypothetical protein
MKAIKYICGLGLSVVLSGMLFTSCTDANDWGVDTSFDRLFGTKQSSFTVTEGAVSAEVKWDATVNTEYYIIEVSTDSLYDDIPMGAENSIVYGEDGSIIQSPYTITGLLGETTYYLRIKSMSKDKQSNWVYLPDYKFTTDKEQILNEPSETEITDEAVSLTWEAGLEVTHITYTQDGTLVTYELSDEEKAAGKVTLMGLLAMTDYTFYIYNGEILRGEIEVTTGQSVMVESTMNNVAKNSATFSWDTSVGRLTGYYFAEGDVYPQEANHSLTDEQIASGKIELTGLEPNTTYTVAVMRDKTVRAMQTFKTEMGIPSDYTQVTVADASDWNNALAGNSGKQAIVLAGDVDISNGTAQIPSGITSLLVWGGDDTSVKSYTFKTKGISFAGNMDAVELYNMNLISNGSTGNYIFDLNGITANVTSLSVTSCDVSETRGVCRVRSGSSVKIENAQFSDCRFKEIGSYGLITQEGASVINNVVIKNSTYYPYSAGKYLLQNKASNSIRMTIDSCTFYGFTYAILDNQAGGFEVNISNTIFGGIGTKRKFAQEISSCIIEKCENVFLASGNSFESTIGEQVLEYSDEDLFNAPSAYDFTVKVADYKNFGDPYWNK